MFSSPEDLQTSLDREGYICSKEISTVVYLSYRLRKPLLVEGPAGVGKTELGKVLSGAMNRELIRLQCYEGLDESKALYEWEYAKQLLYTQILKEKISEVIEDTKGLKDAVKKIAGEESAFFSDNFILPRPLLKAILSDKPVILLIDEVDKSDPEFEAFLLEVLSDFQVSVPELGTLKAKHIPQVVLTSNNTREMSDALKRRCIHLYMNYPAAELEEEIIKRKVPEIDKRLISQVVRVVDAIRCMDIKKQPSISETLDWALSLVIINAKNLDSDVIRHTINTLVKYQSDADKVMASVEQIVMSAGA